MDYIDLKNLENVAKPGKFKSFRFQSNLKKLKNSILYESSFENETFLGDFRT